MHGFAAAPDWHRRRKAPKSQKVSKKSQKSMIFAPVNLECASDLGEEKEGGIQMDSSDDVDRRRGGKSSDDLVLAEDGAGRSVNFAPSSSSSGAGRGRAKKTRNSVEIPI